MKALKKRDFLTLLAQSKTPKRRALLAEWANKSEIDSLSEIVYNTLRGNIKLNKRLFKKLKRCKNHLRELANKKNSITKKRKIIKQNGGFLSVLIPTALSLLTSVVPKIIKSFSKKKIKRH